LKDGSGVVGKTLLLTTCKEIFSRGFSCKCGKSHENPIFLDAILDISGKVDAGIANPVNKLAANRYGSLIVFSPHNELTAFLYDSLRRLNSGKFYFLLFLLLSALRKFFTIE
jgi:hypothetical protein